MTTEAITKAAPPTPGKRNRKMTKDQLLFRVDTLYDYVLEQDPSQKGLLIYKKLEDVTRLIELANQFMKTRPGTEDLQREIIRQDEVIVSQQSEIERLKELNAVLNQPSEPRTESVDIVTSGVQVSQSQLDEIATALRFCPVCKTLLEKFCAQYSHRTAESVVREALGGWFHHWPHWRGCPPISMEGA